MATSADFAAYAADQLTGCGIIHTRRMFGEYMVYVNQKPLLLLCDNQAYVKPLPELSQLLAAADKGVPYPGAREHYVLDIDQRELLRQVVAIMEPLTPLPRPRKKKQTGA